MPSATALAIDPPGKPEHIETRLFINGEFTPATKGKKFDIYNPTSEKLTASVHEADAEDVDKAVSAAKAAFPAWSELSANERGAYIMRLADAMEKALDEIEYVDAISMGKPMGKPTGPFSIALMKEYASMAYDVQGESSLNTANMVNISVRQPFGACAAIIPWNAPLPMFVMKVGPALITGNTLVLKSSEKAPLSCLVIARLCQEIGLPKGVLNILSGFGIPCGEALSRHMDIRKISFTGSTRAGKAIRKAAAESNLKKVTLELGGKAPLIVFDDADLSRAVPAAAQSALENGGQACICSSRVYVHEAVAEDFIAGMKEAMSGFVANNPLVPGTIRGPLADKLQFDHVMGYIQYSKDQNLNIRMGGDRIGSEGYFVAPTIITDVPEDSKIMKEEVFGPVVCINAFNDEEEVLKRANDSEYGLYASVFTRDISRALRFAKKFEAGAVGVNCSSPTATVDMPFTGWKQSGDGVEMSKHVIDHWTELKSIYIAL